MQRPLHASWNELGIPMEMPLDRLSLHVDTRITANDAQLPSHL
jgi:hypothetical protein